MLIDCEPPEHKLGCDTRNREDCQACVWLREVFLDSMAYMKFLHALEHNQFNVFLMRFGRC